MSNFGTAVSGSTTVAFVESADPVDMQRRITEALSLLAIAQPVVIVTDITLAGAGDGHTFVTLIEYAPGTSIVSGGLVPALGMAAACYLASENEALTSARAALTPFLALFGGTMVDEQLAGATKGTRFMGLIILVGPGNAPSAVKARGQIAGDDLTIALSNGTTTPLIGNTDGAGIALVTFSNLPFGQQNPLSFDSPSPGVLRYTGAGLLYGHVHASLSIAIDSPGGNAKLAIVSDPGGAQNPPGPFLIGAPVSVATNAVTFPTLMNIGAHGFLNFVPASFSGLSTDLGLQVFTSEDATVVSAQLLALEQ